VAIGILIALRQTEELKNHTFDPLESAAVLRRRLWKRFG
jgi:hypothetical protein